MTKKNVWLRRLISVSLCAALLGGVGASVPVSANGTGMTVNDMVSDGTTAFSSLAAVPASKTLFTGESFIINLDAVPENASENITCRSNKSNIASVEPIYKTVQAVNGETGKEETVTFLAGCRVNALSKGRATVIFESESGKKATCSLTIKQAVESIALDRTAMEVEVGGSANLRAYTVPGNHDETITWKSADSSIASVAPDGLVTGNAVGTTSVKVRTSGGKYASCKVTVVKSATDLQLSASALDISKGKSKTVTAALAPSDTTEKVIWSSSDPSVATVKGGVITGVSAGTARIKAETKSGLEAYVDVCVKVYPSGITLSKSALKLKKGASSVLMASLAPDDTSVDTVKWLTSNSKVATVSNGKVTAVGVGTATITAKTANGKTASCDVTVYVVPNKVTLSTSACTIINGKTKTLTATVYPTASENKSITWTSSDTKVAIVSSAGVVAAKGSGTATITARTFNGVAASCKVTVVTKPSSVKLDKTTATVEPGKSITLTASVLPSDADNKTVTWKSGNTSVATVTNGVVKGVKEGTAVITATTVNGLKATCTVTVKTAGVQPTAVSISKTSLSMTKGSVSTLTAETAPSNAVKTITWTTSDSSVAYVRGGKVTAIGAGTATVTAKTVNGKTASCRVTVTDNTKQKLKAEANANNGEIELTVWCAPDESDYVKKQAENFKKAYADSAYSINIKCRELSVDDTMSRTVDNPSNAADVFLTKSDGIPELVSGRAIAPVTAANSAILNANMTSRAMSEVKYNGSVYAYPRSYSGYYMIYDKRVYSSDDLKTLDSMISKADQNGKAVYFNMSNPYYGTSFMMAAGMNISYNNGVQIAGFDSAEGFNGLSAIRNYAKKAGSGLLWNSGTIGDYAMVEKQFKEGTLAAAVMSPEMISEISAAIGAENVGIAKLPVAMINGRQTQLHSFIDTEVYCVKANSSFPVAAQAFAEYLTRSATLKAFAKEINPDTTLKSTSGASINAVNAMLPYSQPLNETVGGKFWACGFSGFVRDILSAKGNVSDVTLRNYLKEMQDNIDS